MPGSEPNGMCSMKPCTKMFVMRTVDRRMLTGKKREVIGLPVVLLKCLQEKSF